MSAAPLLKVVSRFVVTLKYREPGFALRLGTEREYSATYEIEARDADEARRVALGCFKQAEELSSVGWVREIVSVEVRDERDALLP